MSDSFDKPDRTAEFLLSFKENNGRIANMGFRRFDTLKQRGNRQPLAVYQVEFTDGSIWYIRVGLDEKNKIPRLILTDPNYNDDLPLTENKTPMQLPFRYGEEWFVHWGGDTEDLNYQVSARSQKNAFDLVISHPHSLQTIRTN